MSGANAITLERENVISQEGIGTKPIEINVGRVITWTLIFTNTYFVFYFFAKLFKWI